MMDSERKQDDDCQILDQAFEMSTCWRRLQRMALDFIVAIHMIGWAVHLEQGEREGRNLEFD
jgi:hypothetical protein